MKHLVLAFCFCAFSGPSLAETPAGVLNRCTNPSLPVDTSAQCAELRTIYLAQVNECMTANRAASTELVRLAPSGSNHAYRARYLACSQEVRAKYGPFGHPSRSPMMADLD